MNSAIKCPYRSEVPRRAEVDALPGNTVLGLGTDWCGFCRGAQPQIRVCEVASHVVNRAVVNPQEGTLTTCMR